MDMQRLRFGVRSWVIGLFSIAGLVLIGQGPSQAGLLGGGNSALVRDAERDLQGKERDLLNKRRDALEAEKRLQEAEATQATARQRLAECQKENTEGREAGPDESVSKEIRKLRESLAQAQADTLAAKETAVAAATHRDSAQRALADQQKRVGMARQAVKLEEERKPPTAQNEVDVKAREESLRLAEKQLAEASRQLAVKQKGLIAAQAAQKKSAARWAKQESESLASAAHGRKQVAAELAELKAAVPAALKRREAAAARYDAVKVELQDTWTKANSGDRQASKNLKKLKKGAVKAAGDAAEARVSSADLEKRIHALEELDAELRRIDAAGAGGRVTAKPGSGESEQSLAQEAVVAAERDVEAAQATLRLREEAVAAARKGLATAKAGVAPGMSSGLQAAKTALGDAEKALKALERRAAEARKETEDRTEAVATSEQRERRLEAKLKSEEEKSQPVSRAAKALAEAQRDVQEAQLATETARTAAASAQSAVVAADKDVEQARAAVAEARAEQERMARQEADAERRAAAIKEQEKRVAEAKAEALALQEEVADAMAARDKAQEVLGKLLAKQQEERAETKAELTSTLDEARSEAAEAAAARQAAEPELAAARRAVADSQKAAAEAARNLEAGAGAVQQAEEAEKAAKQASEATSALADELKAAQIQLSKSAKGAKRACDNDEDAKERVSELQAKLVAAEEDAKRKKLGKALLEAGTDAQEAKQARAIAEARYAAAERQVQERQAALDAGKRQVEAVEAARDSLEHSTPSLRALTAAAAKAQKQLAQSEKVAAKAEKAAAKAMAEEDAARQRVAKLAKEGEGSTAADTVSKLAQAIEEARADVAAKQKALAAAEKRLSSSQEAVAAAAAEPLVDSLTSTTATAVPNGTAEQTLEEATQVREKAAQARKAREEERAHIAQVEAVAERRAARIKEQQQRIAEAERGVLVAEAKVADSQVARDRAQERLNKLVAKLQTDLNGVKEDASSVSEEARAGVARAVALRQAAEAELAESRRAVADRRMAVEEATRGNEAAKNATQRAAEAEKAARQTKDASLAMADELAEGQAQLKGAAKALEGAHTRYAGAEERVRELQANMVAAKEDRKREKLAKALAEATTRTQKERQAVATAKAEYVAAERRVQERQIAFDAGQRQAQAAQATSDGLAGHVPSVKVTSTAAGKARKQLIQAEKSVYKAEEAAREAQVEEDAARKRVAELAQHTEESPAVDPTSELAQAIEKALGDVAAKETALAAAGTQLVSVQDVLASETARLRVDLFPDSTAGDASAAATDADGPGFTVSEFVLAYGKPHADLPPIEDLLGLIVPLGLTADAFVAPRSDVVTADFRLSSLPDAGQPITFRASALRCINAAIVEALNERGFIGVFVLPHEDDIDRQSLDDLRKGRTSLRLLIRTSTVASMRTLASGKRVVPEEREDHPKHARIKRNSPVGPPDSADASGDLLRSDFLNDYILRLNRHPGRRVDVAVSSSDAPGEVVLDYLVTENRPWAAYLQTSNTGTETTGEWRERIGFVHNQFTGRDDTLRADLVAANLGDTATGLSMSYEFPMFGLERLRLRPFGSWNEFAADEVGAAAEQFEGSGWSAGLELTLAALQWREVFVDFIAGTRWRYVKVENTTFSGQGYITSGASDFLFPYGGIRLSRNTRTVQTNAQITVETNLHADAHTDEADLPVLGRLNVDEEWTALHWDVDHSFYLDALSLRPTEERELPNVRLVHEIGLRVHGQHVLNEARVPPQFEDVVGGLYSVRGYDESIVAGDSALVANVEYRFHVPRLFTEQRKVEGERGAWNPFLRPDCDLTLRLFYDVGRTRVNRALATEKDQDLMSCGAGIELQAMRYLNIRCDWAVVLNGLEDSIGLPIDGAKSGENRFHIVGTLTW